MNAPIYTIGHSNYPIDHFIKLLHRHKIGAICDVRSHPYSRYVSQYSRDALKATLAEADIAYIFLGNELGARSRNPACYENGKVQYDRLARQPAFMQGIRRVMQGAERYRLALMCAEKNPVDCHRALLVARRLHETGIPVVHILADGAVETHEVLESRLLAACGLPEGDIFRSRGECVADAYSTRGRRIAYRNPRRGATD